ncbi:MAG: hypothetical protein K8S98_02945 [Planctomycetes bacterium]|nr:hypothetical protein [Planctomycetota bacterium]
MLRLLAVLALALVVAIAWWAWPSASSSSAGPTAAALDERRERDASVLVAVPDASGPSGTTTAPSRSTLGPTAIVRPATRVVGRVVAADGRGVAGVNLLAWWSGTEPRLSELPRAQAGEHEDLFAATSNSDGRFELLGLDPRRDYTLTGGGAGWIAVAPRAGCHVDGEGYELEVEAWYALRLAPRRADGSRYASPTGASSWRFEVRDAEGLATAAIPRKLELALAGLEPREQREFETVWLRSNYDLHEIDRVWVHVGLRDLTVIDLPYLRIPRLAVPVAELEVATSAATGVGSLTIRFVAPASQGADLSITPLGTLRFFTADGEPLFALPCGPNVGNPMHSDGLPVGAYFVRFEGTIPGLSVPVGDGERLPVHIDRDTQELELPLPEYGRIVAEVRDELDHAYRGELTLRISPDRVRSVEVSFDRAPYVLELVPFGDYGLDVTHADRDLPPERPDERGQTRLERAIVGAGLDAKVILRPWSP